MKFIKMLLVLYSMKRKSSILYSILALSILIVGGILFYRNIELMCESTIVSKVTSPDTRFEASLEKTDCGATTSTVNKVYISRLERKEKGSEVFKASKLGFTEISWTKDSTLIIKTNAKRIYHFQSFELVNDENELKEIAIYLEQI